MFFLQKSHSDIVGHSIRTLDCHVLFHELANCRKFQFFMQQVVGVMDTETLFKAILPNLKNCSLEVLFLFFLGETSTMRLFLLSREHPKAQPSRRLFLLFLEKPGWNLRPLFFKASDLYPAPRRLYPA